MGLFDYYGECQLKVSDPPTLERYVVGERVPIPDGVYVAREGVVVVQHGRFVAEFRHLVSKWGDVLDPERVLECCTC